MRENAELKGRRYLAEGRVYVRVANGDHVLAHVRGSDQVYACGWDGKRGAWWCSCPAVGRCSHLVALQLVAVRPGSYDA